MIIYRVRQFTRAVIANFRDINQHDNEYIHKYLNKEQLVLFNQLSSFEKRHSLYTARDIERNEKQLNNNDLELLIKASLLHDVGKTKVKLNIIDRTLLVLLNLFLREEKMKQIKSEYLKEKIYLYYNHGEMGYNLLKEFTNNNVLYLVKFHHDKSINDFKLKILQKYDERN